MKACTKSQPTQVNAKDAVLPSSADGGSGRGRPDDCAITTCNLAASPAVPHFIDLTPYLDGSAAQETPSVAEAWPGRYLFYSGRINALLSQPGIDLRNALLVAIARVLAAGGAVLYLDPAGTPGGLVVDMRLLGATPEAIGTRLFYMRCSGPTDMRAAHQWATEHRLTMVVLDGLALAMASAGADAGSEHHVLPFLRRYLRPLADTGAAVVVADYASGSAEKRRHFARGVGNSRYDGASYVVAVGSRTLSRRCGHVTLKISGDCHGGAGTENEVVTELHFAPSGTGVAMEFKPPGAGQTGTPRPIASMKRIMEHLDKVGAASATELRRIGGNAATVDLAVRLLREEGELDMARIGRRHVYSLRPPRFVDVIELT